MGASGDGVGLCNMEETWTETSAVVIRMDVDAANLPNRVRDGASSDHSGTCVSDPQGTMLGRIVGSECPQLWGFAIHI